LWTGSDDGIISVSRDGGKNWSNVTPKDSPKWMMWNCIEADPFKKGTAYFVGTRYKLDDFTPYIYKTEDYGKTWKLITNGIPSMHFARCLRADPRREGLLYVGTEYGMYISFDDGRNWQSFQQNLPVVPITDLTIKDNDLVVATQGRAFWIIDDLGVIQQFDRSILGQKLHVFQVKPTIRIPGNRFSQSFGNPKNAGTNPPSGVVFKYYVKEINDSTKAAITIFDKEHKEIKTFTSDAKDTRSKVDVAAGMNTFSWNLLYPGSERVDGMVLWNGVPSGIVAPPGSYYARFKIGMDSVDVPFSITPDLTYKTTQEEYEQQFAFLKTVQEKFDSTQKTIKDIRNLRAQINAFTALQGKDIPKDVKSMADSINKQMSMIEEALYQTKAKSEQDVLNYPIRLNDKLSGLFDVANSGNFAPSKQSREVFKDISAQVDEQLNKFRTIREKNIPALNELIRQRSLPVIGTK
jgi:hypothetical protein